MAVEIGGYPPIALWQRIWLQFKNASRLGWLIESNWADPFVFAIYTLVRPLAGAFILVFMYLVVVQGSTANPFFAHMYLSNAFFMYVGRVMMALSYAIIDDREHYEMLKYIYISPLELFVFLVGRGMAQMGTTTISVFVTVLLGLWPLGMRIPWADANWGLFVLAMMLGLVAILFMGYLLAGICLLLARHAFAIAEGIAAVLYLLVGAVFPVSILPVWLQVISRAFPLTYWLELIRRSLLGSSFDQTWTTVSNLTLVFWLAGLTVLFGLIAFLVFRWVDGLAKRRGLIDQISGY